MQLRYVLNENPANLDEKEWKALSNGKLSAILSFLRTFGRITVLLLALSNFLGVTGVWLAVPAAEGIAMIAAPVFLNLDREKYHYA